MDEKVNKKEKYQIISLGSNCFPRVLLTEYYLIKTKLQGRKTMPFDLASHSAEVLINHLETDFRFYYDGIKIDVKTKEIRNEKTGSYYPHDKNCLDIDKLKERYDKRIENFKEALNDEAFVFFVIWDKYEDEILHKLYDMLCKIRKENTFKLLVWNYGENQICIDNENISIKNRQLPCKDWNWADEKEKKEKASIDYKTDLIDFTENEIQKCGFEVKFYKPKLSEKINKKIKKIIKFIFSVNNDGTKKIKYLCLLGIKFKLKEIK
ncbi:MAG: papain-like cysteine peptidase [bacterium]|nr:papain-like cysteine peptidase [bacterium]